MASIKYPSNFNEQVNLFKLIYEKHLADGEKSLLNDYNFKELAAKADHALESDKKAKELTRLSQEKMEERRLLFEGVQENMRAIGTLLKAKFRNNPKELGKWGFTVTGD